jgi:type I restriction enzyme M protein
VITDNSALHGIENPNLKDLDSLSEANTDFEDKATLVLAKPTKHWPKS